MKQKIDIFLSGLHNKPMFDSGRMDGSDFHLPININTKHTSSIIHNGLEKNDKQSQSVVFFLSNTLQDRGRANLEFSSFDNQRGPGNRLACDMCFFFREKKTLDSLRRTETSQLKNSPNFFAPEL